MIYHITKSMENAKKLGYNRRTIGIPWCQISDIESHFIKKGFKGNDLISKVDNDIVRLQNIYFEQGNKIIMNKIINIKKKLLEKKIQNNFYKNNDTYNMDKITTNNKRINKNKKSKNKSKNNSNNNSKNKSINNSKNNNGIEDKEEDIDKILNEVEKEMKIKEKNDNVKKLKKIKSKIIEAKNKGNITKTTISSNNTDADANVDTPEGIKIKKRKDELDKHGMDVIEINSKTLRKPIQEYLFHLREQIISIDYDDNNDNYNGDNGGDDYITTHEEYNQKTNFKKALSWVIESNEEKINKINMITKCHKIIYDKDLYHFKLYVKKDDREQYRKIINATVLISNMIGKFRENLESGTNFFKKTALMF